MNPEIKELWLEALKSGDYQQAAGRLVRDVVGGGVGYCCLGVLCDLAVKRGVIDEIPTEAPYTSGPIGKNAPGYYLPAEVAAWAGIDPDVEDERKVQPELAELNDQTIYESEVPYEAVIEYIEEML